MGWVAAVVSLFVWQGCGGAPTEHEEHTSHGEQPARTMQGSQPVLEISPEIARALDLRTEAASAGQIAIERRAPAASGWDPHAVTPLTAQAGGQIRTLLLPRPGEPVERGQVVARLYQPEVRAAFEEMRVAAGLGEPWLSAARERLLAAGVYRAEVDYALASGHTPDTYAVRSSVAGVVLDHPAREGIWLGPGGVIGTVADPSAIVVDLIVNGSVPALGTPVTLRDPASGASWPATVSSLLPTAEAAGIAVRVLPTLAVPVGRPLVAEWSEITSGGVWVPSTAVVDTGERRVVFVEIGEGRYTPRDVRLGALAGDRLQITEGLAEGERVVVSGAFLLDSETQIGAMGHAGHGG